MAAKMEEWCQDVIDANPESWDDFVDGEDGALNFLVGQVMARSGGEADPGEASWALKDLRREAGG